MLRLCREQGIIIVLRVPHTSHLTQGENVRNFVPFKQQLRIEKARRLMHNVESSGMYGLQP